jgi:hypothetical protein
MRSLFRIGRARHVLQRWLLRKDTEAKVSTVSSVAPVSRPTEQKSDIQEQISHFMEELGADSQEWLGRVRIINFDSIRERVGPTWPKLRSRVEILAERIIQDKMAGRDRYLKTPDAEFLVFFAEATPEEARIHCFAIVEAIHQKLFGSVDGGGAPAPRIAECHVIHRDDLALEWQTADSSPASTSRPRSSKALLRGAFRHDPEILDGADVAASTQIIIDSIIACASASHNMAELAPLLMRLQVLSRSLKTLEAALVNAGNRPSDRVDFCVDGVPALRKSNEPGKTERDTKQLGTAWEDIAELVSVLDCCSDEPHTSLLAALGRLRRTRQKRLANLFENDTAPDRFNVRKADPKQFEYTPVFRSASRGEHLHQGIYRVTFREQAEPTNEDDALARHPRYEEIRSELAALEHAIAYLLDRKTSTLFMLMTSVDVETLRAPGLRMRYSKILRSAQLRAKRRLLIEVSGYCYSDDTIGLRRAIDELRLHCHAVFISFTYRGVGTIRKIAVECKKARIHALGLDVTQLNGRNAEIVGAITRLSALGEEHSIPTFVDGIRSISVLTKALAQGVCYVSAPTLRPALPTPDDAKVVTLNDLYVMI